MVDDGQEVGFRDVGVAVGLVDVGEVGAEGGVGGEEVRCPVWEDVSEVWCKDGMGGELALYDVHVGGGCGCAGFNVQSGACRPRCMIAEKGLWFEEHVQEKNIS